MFTGLLATVEFQMCLLLFVALGGYLLASKINQSAIIGVIFAGLIIGPSFLGLITYTDFVRSLASLGAIVLLFVIGLEFKIQDIFKWKYGVIALIGVILPFIGGYFVAKSFGFDFATAIFIGTALTATSVAITANVLREMGKLQSDVAKAIIGAAVIDDILGLLILSTSQQIATSSFSFFPIFWILIKAILFVGVGIIIGVMYLTKAIKKIDNSKFATKYPETVFIFAMMIAFLYALIAESIGLSGIIGAFIAGVSLEGVIIRRGKDYKQGAEYLQIIFASIFFISLGILADIHALTWWILLFLLVLTIIAVLTKLIGCYIPARMQGMSKKDSLAVGFGMSPRGEVAMIVALIGLNAGLIKQDIYVSLVFMSLLTTILTPIILRKWFFKTTEKIGY
jgi:Kef-type K+ transport system membrane component KefB